ncbi:hypothetical protein [Halorubrum halodurans]|uniref:Uncharacterized protein n=1 Tax=Halorubrum halodurans TaxID=1383851 RepID=A0A256IB38_9EURY|nr:hypothetical protein [Halorubrum halodurans]OYR53774.1 hypothetical protein DJ70_15585 [Halorubrum halodurans]
MDRAVPFATAFLVGVCVFAWLAGPVLEARFGAEALLAAYGGVAAGAAATVYVLVRRIDARLGGGTAGAGTETNAADPEEGRATDSVTDRDGDGTVDRDGTASGDGGSRADDTVTVSLDELEALDVEREVRELKAERKSGRDGRE